MSKPLSIIRLVGATLLLTACVSVVSAEFLPADLNAEPNPVARSKKALKAAESAFDDAHRFYAEGDVDQGDAQLENMINALNVAVSSLTAAHKWPLNKKAELTVAHLQRRLQFLTDDISLPQRGWAAYTERKLDEIHDRLLEKVIKK